MDQTLLKLRIESILKHIDTITDDLRDKGLEEFQESDLYVRATCFSLMQIGEQLTHLHKIIGNDYPSIPWSEAIKLRTLIVHVYNKVNASRIYDVAKKDLGPLKTEILKIKIE